MPSTLLSALAEVWHVSIAMSPLQCKSAEIIGVCKGTKINSGEFERYGAKTYLVRYYLFPLLKKVGEKVKYRNVHIGLGLAIPCIAIEYRLCSTPLHRVEYGV